MLKLAFALLFIASTAQNAFGCQVHLTNFIIKKSQSNESDSIVKSCPQAVHDLLNSLILNNDSISAEFFKEAVGKENLKTDLKFGSDKVSIFSLAKELSTLANKTQMKIIEFSDPHGLPSQSNARPNIECNSCNRIGTTTYKVNLNNRTYYGEVQIGIAIPAYSVQKNSFQGTPVEINNLIKKEVITASPEQYISNIDQLRYSKFTQNISSGAVLRKSDVIRETIVSNFRNVSLIIESDGLSIKGSGLSQASGSYGDVIPIKMGSNGKILNAQIIGKDLTRIEL